MSDAYQKMPPCVLTIAGSDSGGGAGIQADLKTFAALGCYGTSVITALTAQNTLGVQAVHPTPPDFVQSQLTSVFDDIPVHAVKTGMLFDAEIVSAVASGIKAFIHQATYGPKQLPLVCDPVCVSTSGHQLLDPAAIQPLIDEMFPLATLITPNTQEAAYILSTRGSEPRIDSLPAMLNAAQRLLDLGAQAVLLKGGHLTAKRPDVEHVVAQQADLRVIYDGVFESNMEILAITEADLSDSQEVVVDVLCTRDTAPTLLIRPRLVTKSTHGTGCTLSSAIACHLSHGHGVLDAVRLATAYTHGAIAHAYPLGQGHGPLNHLHSVISRSLPAPAPTMRHPLTRAFIRSCASLWKEYVEHPFVRQLGEGTLPRQCFVYFIKQDYLYLKYYARAYGLLAAKSSSFAAIASSAATISNVLTECSTHRAFCAEWNISEAELESTPESASTTAYGAYLLDVGLEGDHSKLVMALAACLLGYGEVGLWLKEAAQPNTWVNTTSNPYLKWIEDYSGEHYQNAVKSGVELIERIAVEDPPSPKRYNEWQNVWNRCTLFEKRFWDAAMEAA